MGLVGLALDHDLSTVHGVTGLCRELELVRTEVDTYQVSWGASGNVAAHGSGASHTGTSECPSDEWVIGFQGNADDSNIIRLGVTCGTVSLTGSRTDGYGTSTTFTATMSTHGGAGGSAFDDRCSADELIGGYQGFVDPADGSLASLSPFCGGSYVETR